MLLNWQRNMLRPRKYYIWRSNPGNVPLPRQARALFNIIRERKYIEYADLVKEVIVEVKTRQQATRIITYYTGHLLRRKLIDVLTTYNSLIKNCPHCGGDI